MTRKLTAVLASVLLLTVVVGGVAAASGSWTTGGIANQQTGHVLTGTQQKASYNTTVNTTGHATTTSAAITLVSAKNVSAIPNSSVTTSGTATVSQTTSGWTYSSGKGVWYQQYKITATGSSVTFHVANGTKFAPKASSNTTISTTSPGNVTALAAANITSTVHKPSYFTGHVAYQVVTQPYSQSESFASNVAGGTTVNTTTHTVSVSPSSSTVTQTIRATERASYSNAGENITVTVNNSFAPQSAVSWTNLTNAQYDHASSRGPTTTYVFAVTNATKNASVAMHYNVSSKQAGTSYANATQASVNYQANLLGATPVTGHAYTLQFTSLSAAGSGSFKGGSFLPLPQYLLGLGGLGQALGWFFLIASVIETAGVIYLLLTRKQAGLLGKLTGYLGLPLFGLISMAVEWFLPLYFVAVTIAIAFLLYRTPSADIRRGGPGSMEVDKGPHVIDDR